MLRNNCSDLFRFSGINFHTFILNFLKYNFSSSVYRDFDDKSSLISVLTLDGADELLSSGVIGGGMLPKLQNCIDAVKEGVAGVHILDGRVQHSLLLEFFTDKGIGTAIVQGE